MSGFLGNTEETTGQRRSRSVKSLGAQRRDMNSTHCYSEVTRYHSEVSFCHCHGVWVNESLPKMEMYSFLYIRKPQTLI